MIPSSEDQQREFAQRREAYYALWRLATGLLIVMLAVFLLAWTLEAGRPWLSYVRAFAEASLVGAFADWFAVVALFHRPLGLPIPHTAILPRSKQRIADSLGDFVATSFLDPDLIRVRIDRFDAADFIADWLRSPANVDTLVRAMESLLAPAIELMGQDKVRDVSRDAIHRGIDSIALAPLLGRTLAALIAEGHHAAAYDQAIDYVSGFIRQNRKLIAQYAGAKQNWVSGWIDSNLADRFAQGLLEALLAGRAADHPWRADFVAFLRLWVDRLAHDQAVFDACEALKASVLDQDTVDSYVRWVGEQTHARLTAELTSQDGPVTVALRKAVATLATWLHEEPKIRDMANRWMQQLAFNVISPHRAAIGGYVSETVARWDSATLVNRLEVQFGRDLQFIRLNGTIVGGIIGLALHIATRA